MKPRRYGEGRSGSSIHQASIIEGGGRRPKSRRVALLIGLSVTLMLVASVGAGIRDRGSLSGTLDAGRSGPFPPYILYGFTCGVIGSKLGECQINITNANTNAWMLLESDVLGYYQCDLANMTGGYSDGDLITLNATYQAYSGDNQTYVTETGGKWFNVTIIDMIPEFTNAALPALAGLGILLVLATSERKRI